MFALTAISVTLAVMPLGAETRTGGVSPDACAFIEGWSDSSADSHWGFECEGAEEAEEENWNRYYDPSIGRYLQPEPLMSNPGYVRRMAASGIQIGAYAYAANNPVHFIDPNGLDVTNNTDHPIFVKPENSDVPEPVPAGQTWKGRQDGFVDPENKAMCEFLYKTVDWVDATINKDGTVSVTYPSVGTDYIKNKQMSEGGYMPKAGEYGDPKRRPDWAKLARLCKRCK